MIVIRPALRLETKGLGLRLLIVCLVACSYDIGKILVMSFFWCFFI